MLENSVSSASKTSKPRLGSFGGRVRSDISQLTKMSTMTLRRALFRWAYPWPVVYGFLCELRSFLHRMSFLRTLYEDGLDLGPLVEPHEPRNPMTCARTQGRMLGTQELRKRREWGSAGEMFRCFSRGGKAEQDGLPRTSTVEILT